MTNKYVAEQNQSDFEQKSESDNYEEERGCRKGGNQRTPPVSNKNHMNPKNNYNQKWGLLSSHRQS